jgi:hypothetical protein
LVGLIIGQAQYTRTKHQLCISSKNCTRLRTGSLKSFTVRKANLSSNPCWERQNQENKKKVENLLHGPQQMDPK